MHRHISAHRYCRLKLKTGYIRHEPPEYRFLIRYPPLNRDSAPPTMKTETKNIPYYRLYEKIMAGNPLHRHERIYSSNWQEEPVALTMAKKQYEMIQKGHSEETALAMAKKHVSDLENVAYEHLIELRKVMSDKNVRETYVVDPEINDEINYWREILKDRDYGDLAPVDKGEVDYLIQTKILKWRESERERRMRNPVFAYQFDLLRERIFPEIYQKRINKKVINREEFKVQFLEDLGMKMSSLKSSLPFYYEDYIILFNKLRDRPYLARWNERPRETLSRWIIDTLAFQAVLESGNQYNIQKYLDQLREQFFPMIKYPADTGSFTLPSPEKMREILYKNNIGYKTENKKLYIKRFYLLPRLLFPKQTWTTQILNDNQRLELLMSDKEAMLDEMRKAGFDEASYDEIEKKLQDYTSKRNFRKNLPNYSLNDGDDMISSLEALIASSNRLFLKDTDSLIVPAPAPAPASISEVNSYKESNVNQIAESREEEEEEKQDEELLGEDKEENKVWSNNEEWTKLIQARYPYPMNRLERDTEEYFESSIEGGIEMAEDLDKFDTVKVASTVILAARLGLIYENKEGARRARAWAKTAFFDENFPEPELDSILDEV